MDFMDKNVIVTNRIKLIPKAILYHFGVLTSKIHMAWTKMVCGRLEQRYDYSIKIVYNNFPWCNPTDKQKRAIEKTAQRILQEREALINYSLADMYDAEHMPKKLYDAHQANDRAVMAAYGFDESMSESEIVAALMKLYQKFNTNIDRVIKV